MRKSIISIVVLIVAMLPVGVYSQNINEGKGESLVSKEEEAIVPLNLYHGNGNLTFSGDAIVDTHGNDLYYVVKTTNELIRNEKLFQFITGYYSHVTGRTAFYGCVNGDNNKVLWLKSLESNCSANNSQIFNATENNNAYKMQIAYLNKSYAWNDTLATSIASVQLELDDVETPEIVSQKHYLNAGLINVSTAAELLRNHSATEPDNIDVSNTISNELSVHIWPNPSQQILNVDLDTVPNRIRIVDGKGRVVKELHPKDNKANVSEIDPGLYFLEVHHEDKTQVVKFIKS